MNWHTPSTILTIAGLLVTVAIFAITAEQQRAKDQRDQLTHWIMQNTQRIDAMGERVAKLEGREK